MFSSKSGVDFLKTDGFLPKIEGDFLETDAFLPKTGVDFLETDAFLPRTAIAPMRLFQKKRIFFCKRIDFLQKHGRFFGTDEFHSKTGENLSIIVFFF